MAWNDGRLLFQDPCTAMSLMQSFHMPKVDVTDEDLCQITNKERTYCPLDTVIHAVDDGSFMILHCYKLQTDLFAALAGPSPRGMAPACALGPVHCLCTVDTVADAAYRLGTGSLMGKIRR